MSYTNREKRVIRSFAAGNDKYPDARSITVMPYRNKDKIEIKRGFKP